MRIAGMRENDDGSCLYLIEGEGGPGAKIYLLYEENGGTVRPADPGEAEALFREGLLERCSLPAADVFFPDEVEQMERIFLSGGQKKEEEEK